MHRLIIAGFAAIAVLAAATTMLRSHSLTVSLGAATTGTALSQQRQTSTVVNPTVYLESTIPSYLAARLSRNLIVAAHQQITRQWWAARPAAVE